jgi:hypothetical protein
VAREMSGAGIGGTEDWEEGMTRSGDPGRLYTRSGTRRIVGCFSLNQGYSSEKRNIEGYKICTVGK